MIFRTSNQAVLNLCSKAAAVTSYYAVRKAHAACAEAHDLLGSMVGSSLRILLTNEGGDNTKSENDLMRKSFDGLLGVNLEKRSKCAALTEIVTSDYSLLGTTARLFSTFRSLLPYGL